MQNSDPEKKSLVQQNVLIITHKPEGNIQLLNNNNLNLLTITAINCYKYATKNISRQCTGKENNKKKIAKQIQSIIK